MLHRPMAFNLGLWVRLYRMRQLLLDCLRAYMPYLYSWWLWHWDQPLRRSSQVLSLFLHLVLLRPHWWNLQLCQVHWCCLRRRSNRLLRHPQKCRFYRQKDQRRIWVSLNSSAYSQIWRIQTMITHYSNFRLLKNLDHHHYHMNKQLFNSMPFDQ